MRSESGAYASELKKSLFIEVCFTNSAVNEEKGLGSAEVDLLFLD